MSSLPLSFTPFHHLLHPELVLETHEGARRVGTFPLAERAGWKWELLQDSAPGDTTSWQGAWRVGLQEGTESAATVGVRFTFPRWSPDVYVLLPGAVYAGNRFPVLSSSYPPVVPAQRAHPDLPLQTEVPRLSYEQGTSCLRQKSSDPAFPGIGLFFPKEQTGVWILTPVQNEMGLFGVELEENAGRDTAVLTVFSPGMQREWAYAICCDRNPSTDRARDWQAGDSVSFPLRVEVFPCSEPQGLFDRLVEARHYTVCPPAIRHDIPFSEVWRILEEKTLRENWVEPQGYFSVGVEPMRSRSIFQNWQMGWVGGMITPYALFLCGGEKARDCALRNFDFVFPKGQAPSGYFYANGDGEKFSADDEEACPAENRTLVRKNGDGLFYMLRMLEEVERRGEGGQISPQWVEGLRRCAVAFLTTWDREGEWGQFLDHETGAVRVRGSVSGGIVPAALILAGRRFPEMREACLRVAVAAARHFDEAYLRRGFTNGGPGDAAQCADSESLAGLLESFVTLHEATGDKEWIDAARRAATHVASWTVSYDFPFPQESTFGRLGMLANGTVLANAQNKHSAPGICTHSGLSLLRLYRQTGLCWVMDLLRDIAHTLPQYMSRADRPIPWSMPYNLPEDPTQTTLHPGWMCERVNLTYWGGHENPGEVFYYSCWSEISLLLAIAELPGIYARPETSQVWSLDHIAARWEKGGLLLHNPTPWPARTSVLIESAQEASARPWEDAIKKLQFVEIEPGSEVFLTPPRGGDGE